MLLYNTYKTSREWRCTSSAHVLHMHHGHRLILWDPYYCCCCRCDVTHGWDPCTLARVHLQNSRMPNGGDRFRGQERWIHTEWEVGGYQSLHGCVWVVIYKCSTSHQISYRLLPITLRSRRALVSSLRPLKAWRGVQPSSSCLLVAKMTTQTTERSTDQLA